MKRTLVMCSAVLAAGWTACSKAPEAPIAPLKKVEAPASGLPTAAVAGRGGEAPSPAGMPQDPVHAGARTGMAGAMDMPSMPGHGMVMDPGQLDDGGPALRLTGLGSRAELDKALKDVDGDEAKKRFSAAFRWTFAVDKAQRDVEKARAEYEDLLRAQPRLAACYRGLAYVALSRKFDIDGAVVAYRKALELKPDYPEVHYALAFLFAGSDLSKGREHLKRSLELGMPDEQGLKRTYGLE